VRVPVPVPVPVPVRVRVLVRVPILPAMCTGAQTRTCRHLDRPPPHPPDHNARSCPQYPARTVRVTTRARMRARVRVWALTRARTPSMRHSSRCCAWASRSTVCATRWSAQGLTRQSWSALLPPPHATPCVLFSFIGFFFLFALFVVFLCGGLLAHRLNVWHAQ